MKRRSLVFAATIGCALPSFASEGSLTPVEKYDMETKRKDDEFIGNTEFSLKFDIPSNDIVKKPIGSLFSLYTFNKEEIADRHGILLFVTYKTNKEPDFNDVYDSDKNKLYIGSVRKDKSILRSQGFIIELLFIPLNWNYLFHHAEKGINLRVYARNGGNLDISVSSDQIKGFLLKQWGQAVKFDITRRVADITYKPDPELEKQLKIISNYK